jgi:hypothetical protein
LSKTAGTGHWVIDVRSRVGLKPLYYLVFASRHVAGLEYFDEASHLHCQISFRPAAQACGLLLAEIYRLGSGQPRDLGQEPQPKE